MSSTDAPPRFSLAAGGPFHRALVALRLMGPAMSLTARRCLALTALTWVPIIVLTTAEGTLVSGPGPAMKDVSLHLRFLLALPLFTIGERAVEHRFSRAVAHLPVTGLIDAKNRGAYEGAIARAHRMRDSVLAEVLVLVVACALSFIDLGEVIRNEPASWILPTPTGHPSIAGLWFFFVSAPLFRFVGLRWLWRLALWTAFLIALARTDLRLSATHPDRRGGLSVLCVAHSSFGWVIFAFGVSIASYFAEFVLREQVSVQVFWKETLAFTILAPAIFSSPLLAFAWPIERCKRRYHEDYGAAAADFVRRYDPAWVLDASREPIPLGSGETSAHADLGTSFELSTGVHSIPVTKEEYLFLFAAAAIPMIAFLMMQIPILEILSHLREAL